MQKPYKSDKHNKKPKKQEEEKKEKTPEEKLLGQKRKQEFKARKLILQD